MFTRTHPPSDFAALLREQAQLNMRLDDRLAQLRGTVEKLNRAHAAPPPPAARGWHVPPSTVTKPAYFDPYSWPKLNVDPPRFDGANVIRWITRIQQYYNHSFTPLDDRLYLIQFLLDDAAAEWFVFWEENNTGKSWDDFLVDIKLKFDTNLSEDYVGQLARFQKFSRPAMPSRRLHRDELTAPPPPLAMEEPTLEEVVEQRTEDATPPPPPTTEGPSETVVDKVEEKVEAAEEIKETIVHEVTAPTPPACEEPATGPAEEEPVLLLMTEERTKNDDQDKAFPRAKMAKSSETDSVGVSNDQRPENPNLDDFRKNTDFFEATGNGGNKGRSCKGCLYYSSQLKSNSRHPLCVGLSRSIPNTPRYIVGKFEMEASKEGKILRDFRYGCIGYSLYADQRKEFKIDELLTEEGIGDSLAKVVYLHGVDNDGHPVCYNAFGEFQDKKLYNTTFGDAEKKAKFLRWYILLLETNIGKYDFSPDSICTIVQITDLKNLPGLIIFKKDLRLATNDALQLLQDNYSDFVAKQVFINVPWWYVTYNRLISPFLKARKWEFTLWLLANFPHLHLEDKVLLIGGEMIRASRRRNWTRPLRTSPIATIRVRVQPTKPKQRQNQAQPTRSPPRRRNRKISDLFGGNLGLPSLKITYHIR